MKKLLLFSLLVIIVSFSLSSALADDYPNLVITNAKITPLTSGTNQFSITYKVKNIGSLCGQGFNAGLTRNGTVIKQVYIKALAPNEVYDGNIVFSSQQANAIIVLRIDLYNVINESNTGEQDNKWQGVARHPVSLRAPSPVPIPDNSPYDLALGTLTLTGQNRLKITITNAGPPISQNQFNKLGLAVKIKNSAVTQNIFKVLPLTRVDPNGTLKTHGNPPWQAFVWPLRSTDYGKGIDPFDRRNLYEVKVSLGVISPGGNSLRLGAPDSNPVNNTITKRFGGKADLVVCFRKQVHHTRASRRYTYRPVVKNIGSIPSRSSILRFYIKDKGGKNYPVPPIPAGGEYRGVKRNVYWARRGNRRFKLTVDKNNDIDEAGGEFNNVIQGMIYVNKYAPSSGNSQTKCSNEPGMAN